MVIRQQISDGQWAVLAPLFPKPKRTGRPPLDMRLTVEGIAWRFRTGAPWRDVPERFGNWNSIYQRFADWAEDGTWARVLAAVQGEAGARGEVAWTVSVDSSITRVHQHGASLPRDTGGCSELHESLAAGQRGSGAAGQGRRAA
jgi:transposase